MGALQQSQTFNTARIMPTSIEIKREEKDRQREREREEEEKKVKIPRTDKA